MVRSSARLGRVPSACRIANRTKTRFSCASACWGYMTLLHRMYGSYNVLFGS